MHGQPFPNITKNKMFISKKPQCLQGQIIPWNHDLLGLVLSHSWQIFFKSLFFPEDYHRASLAISMMGWMSLKGTLQKQILRWLQTPGIGRGGNDVSSLCHLSKVLLPDIGSGQIFTRKSQARFSFADRCELMYWGDLTQKYVFLIARIVQVWWRTEMDFSKISPDKASH